MIGKAALSISYGGGYYANEVTNDSAHFNRRSSSIATNNPLHCKIMCLIGVAFCSLVDCKLFNYVFEPI